MDNNTTERIDRELDWDSEISYETPQYVTLPEGVYPFRITKLERTRYEPKPGSKLPACNEADITVEARGKDGISVFTQRLFLHSRCEGILTAFFTCIGQRKHGDKMSMNWNEVEGATGRALLSKRSFTTRQGNVVEVNDVKRWLDPEKVEKPAADEGDDW